MARTSKEYLLAHNIRERLKAGDDARELYAALAKWRPDIERKALGKVFAEEYLTWAREAGVSTAEKEGVLECIGAEANGPADAA